MAPEPVTGAPKAPPRLEVELEALARAEHGEAFRLLGPHLVEREGGRRILVRTIQPYATAVSVVLSSGEAIPTKRLELGDGADGIFEALMPPACQYLEARDYRLRIQWDNGSVSEVPDAYAFPPVLTDFDLHLLGEGAHQALYEKMGAHVREIAGVRGVQFAVWAPNALRGERGGRFQPLGRARARHASTAEIRASGRYSFRAWTRAPSTNSRFARRLGDLPFLKADPYAFEAELRPKSASRGARRSTDTDGKTTTGCTPARSGTGWPSRFRSTKCIWVPGGALPEENTAGLRYRELADQLIPYVKQMGYTHIELLPVMEHPFDGSWGYQTIGYFAATSRYGTPDGLHVLHRPLPSGRNRRDSRLDAGALPVRRARPGGVRRHASLRARRSAPRPASRLGHAGIQLRPHRGAEFLLANALFWFDKYHVDGLRVDAVASMLYLDYSQAAGRMDSQRVRRAAKIWRRSAFLKRLNEVVYARYPGVLMIAEESTAWPAVSRPTYLGGLGFNLKWNMGWMNDTLQYFSLDPIYRKYNHNRMTFSMLYAFTENFVLPLSHDEVVHGKASLINKMPGDLWQQFANLAAAVWVFLRRIPARKCFSWASEFGQRSEWNHSTSLEWGLLAVPGASADCSGWLPISTRSTGASRRCYEVDFEWHGFEWIDCNDAAASVLSFMRRARDPQDFVVVRGEFHARARMRDTAWAFPSRATIANFSTRDAAMLRRD